MEQNFLSQEKQNNQSAIYNPDISNDRILNWSQIEKILQNHLKISNINDMLLQSHDMRFEQAFKIISLLGLGSFGVVLEVQNQSTNQVSALKIISQKNQQVYQIMRNELIVLQELQHPNIIKFKQIFYSSDYVFIEMERMTHGTLQQQIDYLKKLQNKTMDDIIVASIMKDILSGLSVIHEKNFIHRDLKPDNILLNITQFRELQVNGSSLTKTVIKNKYEAKIADFGLSAEHKVNVYSAQENMDEKMGTILYMAPEQALGQSYGKRIDIWACGIIFYKMITGEHPFYKQGDNEKQYIRRISQDELTCDTTMLSPLAQSLFWRLCSRSLQDRYSVHQALKHPYITRNSNDKAPLTQGEEVKLVEADSAFRRIQSCMLFMAIQKMHDKVINKESIELSIEYKQKIEHCNNGLYIPDNITDLYISPQGSETCRGVREYSDLDFLNDKSSHFRAEDQSFAASKQDTSEFSINSKFTTAISHKKSKHRPPAIQIKKQHINLEPKSAFLKDQQQSLKTIDTIQQIMYQTNSNTEDSREMSPLTQQQKQIVRVKINKRASIPLENIVRAAQEINDFKGSPIFQSTGNQQFTPGIDNRAKSIARGSIDEFNLSKKVKGTQSTYSGKSQMHQQESNILKIKKSDIQTTSKKNPILGKAFTLNSIPCGPQTGLQLQQYSKSSDSPNVNQPINNQQAGGVTSNKQKMMTQNQDSKFKPPINNNSQYNHKHQKSLFQGTIITDQNFNSNMQGTQKLDNLNKRLIPHSRKSSAKFILNDVNIENSNQLTSQVQQQQQQQQQSLSVNNKQSLTKQIIQETKQEAVRFQQQQQQRRNKQNYKRSSLVSNSQDFTSQQMLFGTDHNYKTNKGNSTNKNSNYNNQESQQFSQQQLFQNNPPQLNFDNLAMTQSQKRLQKPFIIHQKKSTKNALSGLSGGVANNNGGAIGMMMFSSSNPITPTVAAQKQQLANQIVANQIQYQSSRDLYNNTSANKQTANIFSSNTLKSNHQIQPKLNMHKASLAEQLMQQINQLSQVQINNINNNNNNNCLGGFTSNLMQLNQQQQINSSNTNNNNLLLGSIRGSSYSTTNANTISGGINFGLFQQTQQQQQQMLPTINGKRLQP